MKLDIISKNYRMTDRLEEIITTKLNKLDKYFPNGNTTAKVVLNGDEKRCRMEISINAYGNQIRSEVYGDTMYYIVDDILPKLERQIVKHRGKWADKHKTTVTPSDYMFTSEVIDTPNEYAVAKTKKFPIKREELKEAVENLEMIGHDFYLFVNVANNQVEAVYRRHDGSIGHLEPYIE